MRDLTEHMRSIPPEVAGRLGYYVYLYIDPRNHKPFYVGKGQGARILSHLSREGESRICDTLAEIESAGLEPRIDVLAHGLPDEQTALSIESAAIDILGLEALANEIRGWRSIHQGRAPLRVLWERYAAKPVEIVHAVMLIRINRLFRYGMTAAELWEVTRGVWKVSSRRNRAKYALAVFEGVVQEGYEIFSWQPGGTTPYAFRTDTVNYPGRLEFTGTLAPEDIRQLYVGRSVAKYLKSASQFPITYVNVPRSSTRQGCQPSDLALPDEDPPGYLAT